MTENYEKELLDAIRELSKQIRSLSVVKEDVAAYKLFEKTQGLIKKWLGLWLTLATVILGITGYASYNKIVDKATDSFTKTISPKIEQELKEHSTARMDEIIEKQTSNIIAFLQKRSDQVIKDFALQLSEKLERPDIAEIGSPKVNSNDDIFAGKYVVSHYVKRISGNIYETKAPLNVRTEPNVTGEIVGILNKGDRIEIMKDMGLWLQINRINTESIVEKE